MPVLTKKFYDLETSTIHLKSEVQQHLKGQLVTARTAEKRGKRHVIPVTRAFVLLLFSSFTLFKREVCRSQVILTVSEDVFP